VYVCGDVGKFNPLRRAAISSVAGILNREGDHFHFTRREIECFTRCFNSHFCTGLAAVSEYYNALFPRLRIIFTDLLASLAGVARLGSARRGETANRARNIDSQFGSESRKAERASPRFLGPASYFSPSIPRPSRSFLLPCPSI
jgi:hypothetical protein